MTRVATVIAIAMLSAATAAAQGGFGFGFGGPGQQETKVVAQFDQDGDKRLNAAERRAARDAMNGRRGGRSRRASATTVSGARLTPADVKAYPGSAPVYDAATIRTIFLQFENADWERELADFYNTDVDVPAAMMVDGKTFKDVGVHFRGNSSYRMVPAGYKHSLNLTLDFVHEKQDFGGYNSFNLLNANNDATFVRTLLYGDIARKYIPTAKVNYVRVAINGESWGIYVSSQQVDKRFLREWYSTTKGYRWRVPGSPRGRGGLEYLGDNPAAYERLYQIKGDESPQAWADLIRLCKVLNETPSERLEAALAPLLDIDGALKFLALEMAMANTDGYWTRASDYNLYEDSNGRFHIIPHDFNEGLGGDTHGFGGSSPRAGPELDPLTGLSDTTKPLRTKLLAIPSLRARYLGYVREIADKWLDWRWMGPVAARYQALIAADIKTDTRKLYTLEEFEHGLTGPGENLKAFVDRRRAYLLSYKDRP